MCLTQLIAGKLAEPRIITLITTRGIAFPIDSATERRLKRAGATPAMLAAAREKAPKPKPAPPAAPAARPAPGPPPAPAPSPAPSQPVESPAEVALRAETEFWNTIKDSSRIQLFEDYVHRYPQGKFSEIAHAKIRDLTAARLGREIEQALRDHRWEAAETGIAELLKVSPDNQNVQAWRKTIADARVDTQEIEFWNTISNSDKAEAFEDYLRRYPTGQFIRPANAKLHSLRIAGSRSVIEKAMRDRRWNDAESGIAELLKLTPENDEVRAWRKTISAARARDAAGIEFVMIQPGEFTLGCSADDSQCELDEKPSHRVRITKGFEIGKYEVLQAEWESVMGSNPSRFKGAHRPVETVSWNDVQQFLQKMNAMNNGYKYRLPTEAEWEYAARAGSTAANPGPLDAIGWYGNNSGNSVLDALAILRTNKDGYAIRLEQNGNQTHAAGQKQPNVWGLYDVIGNVWEWVEDWYTAKYYLESPPADPQGPPSGASRVLRGGSWYNPPPKLTRLSARYDGRPGVRSQTIGFRCVREPIP